MPVDVIDFSVQQHSSASLKAAGVRGLIRYLSIPGGRPAFNEEKRIKRPEYDDRLANGLEVALVMQVDKADYLGGYDYGARLGQAAIDQCNALGHPLEAGALLCVQDSSIPQSNFGTAVEFMRGYATVWGRPMPAYCGTNLGVWLVGAGHCSWLWRPGATSWSTAPSDAVRVIQLSPSEVAGRILNGTLKPWNLGPAFDYNDRLAVDYGQNPRPGVLPPPAKCRPAYNPEAHDYGLYPFNRQKPALGPGFGYTDGTQQYQQFCEYANWVMRVEAGQHIVPCEEIVWTITSMAACMNIQRFFGLPVHGWMTTETWAVIDGLATNFGRPR